jgi:dolichol kinase
VITDTIIDTPKNIAVGFTTGPEEQSKQQPPSERDQIPFSSELIRKAIHLSSLSIPILYYYIHKTTAVAIFLPVCVISIFIDVGRFYIPAIHRLTEKTFAPILRPHERKAGLLNGATYVFVSAFICVIVFPKLITVTAFSILIVSDGSSALFGRAFGKHKFLDKSLEGSLAFVLTGILVVLIAPKVAGNPIEFAIGIVGVIVAAIAEAGSVSLRLDDNFSVPISAALTMWGLYWLAAALDPARYELLYRHLLQIS